MFIRLLRTSLHLQISLFAFCLTPITPIAVGQGAAPEGLATDDWNSIRAAYDAGRHIAHETDDGFEARNPKQAWRMSFDSRGFLIEPDASAWSWGLELVSYGFEGEEQFVGDSACASAEGGRVAYAWDDGIEEWYVNDTRGFEHGFTVHERPEQSGKEVGELQLALHVRGDLTPQVQASRRGVAFVDQGGRTVVTYSGLTVFDADGRTLDARFDLAQGVLRLSVDEQGARYPLTIDPIAEQALLKAIGFGSNDQFGASVAISGDTVVAGAWREASNVTGVNGDHTDNSAPLAGAAYVFVRTGSTWSQQAYLKASNTTSGDQFGASVAIADDTVVVGARFEDGLGMSAGAAYVFVRSGTTWAEQAYLKASNAGVNDQFGNSVTVSGNTVAVGARLEASNATGINGDETNNALSSAGAAYVFVQSGTSWAQEAYLKASNALGGKRFGQAVALSADTLIVSAPLEASNSTGVNGDENNTLAPASGAAYVFVRAGTVWSQQAYLKASNTESNDNFGWSAAVSGDSAVVSAYQEDSSTGGDESDNGALTSGAAYVFVRSGTDWSQEAYLKASNPEADDQLGWSVAISGDRVIVGAHQEDSNAVGIDGDQTDNSSLSSGAAYTFVRSGTSWSQQGYLKASNTDAGDRFGIAVSVWGSTAVVGADREGLGSGATYVFDLDASSSPIDLCNGDGGDGLGCSNCPCMNNAPMGTIGGCLNRAGTSARISATGDTSASLPPGVTTDLRFTLAGAPPGAFCVMLSGSAVAPQNMANMCFGLDSGVQSFDRDGLRCAVMNTKRHGGRSANMLGEIMNSSGPSRVWGGEAQPGGGLWKQGGFISGQTRYFQVTFREDPMTVCMRGLNTSQAVAITFEP